jgi:hypothetical protein
VVLENGVIAGIDDTRPFRRIGKLCVVGAEIGADGEAALFLQLLIAQFLPTRLNGEVGLPLRDDFLGGIGILNDEVTGVARHHHGFRRSLGSAADLDHFGDVNEMIHSPFPYAFFTFSHAAVHSGSLSPR